MARAFGLAGQYTGAKAHDWFMRGNAAAFNRTKRRPPGWSGFPSAACDKAYQNGYELGLKMPRMGE